MTGPEHILDGPEPLAQQLSGLVSPDTAVRCHGRWPAAPLCAWADRLTFTSNRLTKRTLRP